jgi:magnesium transporter
MVRCAVRSNSFDLLLDHIITMLQNLGQYDSVLARSHSNYLAQINIELSQLSNGTNKVVNRLTFFATMAIPLNLVAGLFGMNVMVRTGVRCI